MMWVGGMDGLLLGMATAKGCGRLRRGRLLRVRGQEFRQCDAFFAGDAFQVGLHYSSLKSYSGYAVFGLVNQRSVQCSRWG